MTNYIFSVSGLESCNTLAITGLEITLYLAPPGGEVLLVLLHPDQVDDVQLATDEGLQLPPAPPELSLQLIAVPLLEAPPAVAALVVPTPVLVPDMSAMFDDVVQYFSWFKQ